MHGRLLALPAGGEGLLFAAEFVEQGMPKGGPGFADGTGGGEKPGPLVVPPNLGSGVFFPAQGLLTVLELSQEAGLETGPGVNRGAATGKQFVPLPIPFFLMLRHVERLRPLPFLQ
jgi:hypothetical protein